MNLAKPALFGINHSNRDFTQKDTWGKNQFNSSFPAALACYMSSKGLSPVYLNIATKEISKENKITRQLRSVIWLLKMLLDFCNTGKINHVKVIDELSYNTKNDKAFAVSGRFSHPFMTCNELTTPRITKNEIKNIILGNGHLMLSPERRFDAIIYNSPDLFN